MKIIKLNLFFPSILYLLLGCRGGGEPATTTKYSIQNQTTHDIRLKEYTGKSIGDTFYIKKNSQIEFEYQEMGDNSFFPEPFEFRYDSLKLIYDDTVVATHYSINSLPSPKDSIYGIPFKAKGNLMNYGNYQGGKVKENYYQLYYILSEKDYQEALRFKK